MGSDDNVDSGDYGIGSTKGHPEAAKSGIGPSNSLEVDLDTKAPCSCGGFVLRWSAQPYC